MCTSPCDALPMNTTDKVREASAKDSTGENLRCAPLLQRVSCKELAFTHLPKCPVRRGNPCVSYLCKNPSRP